MSTPAPAAATQAPRPRRWLWIALVISLALNALVAGVVLRSVWTARTAQALSAGALGPGFPEFVRTLPQERRDTLRSAGFSERPLAQQRPLRFELRRARREMADAFLSEPFDRERFQAAQARVLDAEVKLRQMMMQSFSDIAVRMTPEERRRFLAWRERGPGAMKGPPDDPDEDGRPGERPFGKRRP